MLCAMLILGKTISEPWMMSFKCLRNASLTLNLSKCEFGCATVRYLGKEVGNGQVRPLNSKAQFILLRRTYAVAYAETHRPAP